MQNFIEIHQRNPELLSSGRFRPPPPRLDRSIERPRLDRVKRILVLIFATAFIINLPYNVIFRMYIALWHTSRLNLGSSTFPFVCDQDIIRSKIA